MHSSRAGTTGTAETAEARAGGRERKAAGGTAAGGLRFDRASWTVLCAVAAVLLGPAAATASALDQANKAPLHHAVRAQQSQGHLPADTGRGTA
ncbi:hypothetical protein ACJ6WF_10865 [Streptomyces sp. MMS24-I2-30]|uniref:hypothetical protein n=1 Tax=Streptomyces sp. MMS24-I2-30 TaxID=3351564 RepID=UPI003896AD6B